MSSSYYNSMYNNDLSSYFPQYSFCPDIIWNNPSDYDGITSPMSQMRTTTVDGVTKTRRHDGIDIGAPIDSSVYSASEGFVTTAQKQNIGDYGKNVRIKHTVLGGYYETRYGHLSEVLVRVGQFVFGGQTIGYVGMSGRSNGPHLHFEIRWLTTPRNPVDYVYR